MSFGSVREIFCRHFADKQFSRRWYRTVPIDTKFIILMNRTILYVTWEDWVGYRASYF